jgi:hypothetical protein
MNYSEKQKQAHNTTCQQFIIIYANIVVVVINIHLMTFYQIDIGSRLIKIRYITLYQADNPRPRPCRICSVAADFTDCAIDYHLTACCSIHVELSPVAAAH